MPASVHVSLAVTTDSAYACPNGKSCDRSGNEFQYHMFSSALLAPPYSSSSTFPGPPQIIAYYDSLTVESLQPRALPLRTKATLRVKFEQASLRGRSLGQLLSNRSKCRLDQCAPAACFGGACPCLPVNVTCASDCGSTCAAEAVCHIEYVPGTSSMLVHLAAGAGGHLTSNRRALALSFNGQDWVQYLNESIVFYHLPVAVSHLSPSPSSSRQVYSFGVVTDANDILDYYRIASSSPGAPLVSYMQEPECDTRDPTDIDCTWRIPRSAQPSHGNTSSSRAASASADGREAPGPALGAPRMVYRFAPGTCSLQEALAHMERGAGYLNAAGAAGIEDDSAELDDRGVPHMFVPPPSDRGEGCCQQGKMKLDVSMTLDAEMSRFVKLSGATPQGAPVGDYHVCFSLDGEFFVPMIYNHFVTFQSVAGEASYRPQPFTKTVASFFFYSMAVTGQSLTSGPSYGPPYELAIFTEGLPLMDQLAPYAPSIRVYFGDVMQKQATYGEEAPPDALITIDSATRMRVRVPTVGALGVNQSSLGMAIYITLDNHAMLPPQGLPFTFFPPPTIGTWFPLYGLFETETTVAISGEGFVDTGEARCRCPSSLLPIDLIPLCESGAC